MTIEAWVYPTSGLTSNAWRTVLMKEQTGEFVYTLYGNGDLNQPYTLIYSSGAEHGMGGGGTLPLNTWTHLSATYDGSTIRLYRNGALVSSLSYAGSIQTSTGPLDIGANMVWTDEVFNGRIDEVRVYNRALTASQIQTDMNTPLP
jgi:hypothetical protein